MNKLKFKLFLLFVCMMSLSFSEALSAAPKQPFQGLNLRKGQQFDQYYKITDGYQHNDSKNFQELECKIFYEVDQVLENEYVLNGFLHELNFSKQNGKYRFSSSLPINLRTPITFGVHLSKQGEILRITCHNFLESQVEDLLSKGNFNGYAVPQEQVPAKTQEAINTLKESLSWDLITYLGRMISYYPEAKKVQNTEWKKNCKSFRLDKEDNLHTHLPENIIIPTEFQIKGKLVEKKNGMLTVLVKKNQPVFGKKDLTNKSTSVMEFNGGIYSLDEQTGWLKEGTYVTEGKVISPSNYMHVKFQLETRLLTEMIN